MEPCPTLSLARNKAEMQWLRSEGLVVVFFQFLRTDLFLATLGFLTLHSVPWLPSEQELIFIACVGAVAPPVAEAQAPRLHQPQELQHTQAQEFWLTGLVAQGMQNLPGPGGEPVSPALASGLLSTPLHQ